LRWRFRSPLRTNRTGRADRAKAAPIAVAGSRGRSQAAVVKDKDKNKVRVGVRVRVSRKASSHASNANPPRRKPPVLHPASAVLPDHKDKQQANLAGRPTLRRGLRKHRAVTSRASGSMPCRHLLGPHRARHMCRA
jgi:hypothetical protein